MAFGSATNIVASSLDSYALVIQKYKKAKSNLDTLQRLGASLLFGVDATTMKSHCDLQKQKFDRIIYNFPHAGFHGKEDGILLVAKHRNLVHHFFRNASGMLRAYGEIHVNHKTTAPYCFWNLEDLGHQNSLKLIECVDFKIEDYPGYNNKRGSGPRCDEPFPLKQCSTFKFQLSPASKKIPGASRNLDLSHCRNLELQRIPISRQQQPNSFELMRGLTNFTGSVVLPPAVSTQGEGYGVLNGIPGTLVSPRTLGNRGESSRISNGIPQSIVLPPASSVNIMGECSRIFSGYFNHVLETFGQTDYDVGYFALEALKYGCKTYMAEAPGRSLTGYINLLQELLNLSVLRSAWLQSLLAPDHQL
ncbi:hypothetical protein LguiA_023455 [Lonicera macranthoides]